MRKRSLCCRPVSLHPSVTLVYSIHTAQDIVKLLSPPGSPITLVFRPPVPIPNSKGTASVGRKVQGGWEKFVIFDRNRCISRKRYEIGPWLLMNAYMKSYALYRMVTFSRTFADPYPGLQGHGIFYVEYLNNFLCPWVTDKLLLNSGTRHNLLTTYMFLLKTCYTQCKHARL